jgi:hypothetical protein
MIVATYDAELKIIIFDVNEKLTDKDVELMQLWTSQPPANDPYLENYKPSNETEVIWN